MSFVLSAINIIPLSSELIPISYTYFNTNRNFTETTTTSSFDTISYEKQKLLENIVDLSFNESSLCFLTDNIHLSASLNSLETLSSNTFGFDEKIKFNRLESDSTTDVRSSLNVKNHYLITIPYKTTENYNIIPLKTHLGLNDEYNYSGIVAGKIARDYNGLYVNGNDVYLQYTTDRFPIELKSDEYNNVYIADDVSSFYLSSAGFQNNGAQEGNCPLNSDIIFLDRSGYTKFTDSGYVGENFNGEPLCVWLSGNTWMERWYDANNVTDGDAYISVKQTTPLNNIIDIPCSAKINKRNKLIYLRHGKNRNETFIDSFSSNLIFEKSNEMTFDGSEHIVFPANSSMFLENEMALNLNVYQDSWAKGINTQYFGDFDNDGGYGLFFNTGSDFELITIPSISGNIYGFNNKVYKVFEKSLSSALGTTLSIDYIVTDLYGEHWIYDKLNQKVYRTDANFLVKFSINLSSTTIVKKMIVNSQSDLYILDSFNNRLRRYDSENGELISSSTPTKDNFEITKSDTIVYDDADQLLLDSSNNKFKSLGINIYKNNNLFFHVGEYINKIQIDSGDNLWILYGNSKIIKLSNNGEIILRKNISLPFDMSEDDFSVSFSFIKEKKNNSDVDNIWICYGSESYLIKMDQKGNIIKRLYLRDVINKNNCNTLMLCINGDFSGYDVKRKYNSFGSENSIGSDNPAITLKISLKCGSKTSIYQLHYSCKNLHGWNNIGFTHKITDGKTYINLVINGEIVQSKTINGNYKINYGNKISPFILGGITGKLDARNAETLYLTDSYFIGKMSDLRIYDVALDEYKIRSLKNANHYVWSNMTWYTPISKRTFLEEIQWFHLNKNIGSKSNKYNIRIKNMNITDESVQELIRNSIINVIDKISPVHVELNEIKFD